MKYIRLRLSPSIFHELKTRLVEEDGKKRHKKYINNNLELCKPLAQKLNSYQDQNKSEELELKKMGYSVVYRSFFDYGKSDRNASYNGATMVEADWICRYLSGNNKMTFFEYQKITKVEEVKQFLAPYYKNDQINELDDLYRPISRKYLTSENIRDITDKAALGIDSLFKIPKAVNLHERHREAYYNLLHESNNQIGALNLVERIIVKGEFEYIKLEQVYVNRTIQQNIINELKQVNDNVSILVEGQAGRGKTSLLWYLHNYLSDKEKCKELNFFPLFVKSLDFRESSTKNIIDKIIIANDYIKSEKKKSLLLLIDTVDLLLQEEKAISNLELIFSKLSLEGISIVCTSRIQEASLLKARIEIIPFTLGDYNHTELEEAINRYTFRYVGNFDNQELVEEYKRILDLVDKGYPIKEVCYNPLTLRMLYSIYVPNQIPNNINIHQLYINYWDKRITKDFRIGIDDVEDSGNIRILRKKGKDIDLEKITFLISLMMLFKGEIEIEEKEFIHLLMLKKMDIHLLSLLKNRDIIKSIGSRLIFFHQTFFEFAVAKAMTILEDENGFDLFKNRIKERPNNLFLLPIYEQLLLLNEFNFLNKSKIPSEVISLFESQYVSENHSAIYVFTFLEKVEEEFNNSFFKILKEKDEFIPRYFELLPNISKTRLPKLFDQLSELNLVIESLELKNNYIDLLYRFASYAPELVKDFISKNNLSPEVYSGTLKNDRTIKFIKTLGKLQEHYFEWTNKEYVKLMLNFHHNSTFQIVILNELGSNLNKLKPEHFSRPASYLSEKISSHFDYSGEGTYLQILDSFANLWLYEWKFGREEIVFDLCCKSLDEHKAFEFESKLLALSKFVIENPEKKISKLLTQYDSLTVKGKVKWARVFMFNILLKPSISESKSWGQLIDFIQKIILKSLETKVNSNDLVGLLSAFNIKTRQLPYEVYKSIFTLSEFNSPQFWIDNKSKLKDFLAPCYFADCLGSTDAVKYFLTEEDKEAANIIRLLNGYIGTLLHQKKEIPQKIFLLFPHFKKLPSIVNLIRKLDNDHLEGIAENIDKIRIGLLESSNVKNIRKGLEIFIFLLENDRIEPPKIEMFQEILHKVGGDRQCREKLFSILSKWGFQINFTKSMTFFEENLRERNDEVMDSNFDKYIDLLLSNEKYVLENFELVVNHILEKPTNIQNTKDRLSKIKGVLKLLIKEEHNDYFNIYVYFLSKIKDENFSGEKSLRNFSKLIKSLIFDISKTINEKQQIEILELTMSIPIPISKIILDSIYKQDLISINIREFLDVLNRRDDYPTELKEYLTYNESKTMERFRNETWEELKMHLL